MTYYFKRDFTISENTINLKVVLTDETYDRCVQKMTEAKDVVCKRYSDFTLITCFAETFEILEGLIRGIIELSNEVGYHGESRYRVILTPDITSDIESTLSIYDYAETTKLRDINLYNMCKPCKLFINMDMNDIIRKHKKYINIFLSNNMISSVDDIDEFIEFLKNTFKYEVISYFGCRVQDLTYSGILQMQLVLCYGVVASMFKDTCIIVNKKGE